MRAITFTVTQPDSEHVAHHLFDRDSKLEREQIHHLNVLADGSVVLLGRVRGDLEEARRRLDAHADVLGHSVSAEDGPTGLVYLHARPPAAIEAFLTIPRTHEVFFDFPLKRTEDGRLEVVMIGETNEVLQAALAEVPPELDVTVERIGPYPTGVDGVGSLLTDRQREVLAVARDLGYYAVPRRATHRDIAEAMGLSVGTVGEHLQKIEARVFGHLHP